MPKFDHLHLLKSHFTMPDWLRPIVMLVGGQRAYTRTPGAGVARAAARLAAHRQQWDGVDITSTPTRQQRSAQERAFMKRVRSADKAEAMRSKAKGGAAACR